jgi:hypothetical protein
MNVKKQQCETSNNVDNMKDIEHLLVKKHLYLKAVLLIVFVNTYKPSIVKKRNLLIINHNLTVVQPYTSTIILSIQLTDVIRQL